MNANEALKLIEQELEAEFQSMSMNTTEIPNPYIEHLRLHTYQWMYELIRRTK